MITAEQIQTVLKHVSRAPTTMGEAMADGAAIAALVNLGNALAAGLVKITAVDRHPDGPIDTDGHTS